VWVALLAIFIGAVLGTLLGASALVTVNPIAADWVQQKSISARDRLAEILPHPAEPQCALLADAEVDRDGCDVSPRVADDLVERAGRSCRHRVRVGGQRDVRGERVVLDRAAEMAHNPGCGYPRPGIRIV
jgi:hypothetical protein